MFPRRKSNNSLAILDFIVDVSATAVAETLPKHQRSDTYQKGTRQVDEQKRGILSTFPHL